MSTNGKDGWDDAGELGDDALLVPTCSFCGKTNEEVAKLIAGPEAYICDECVSLCVEIIGEEPVSSPDEPEGRLAGRDAIRSLLAPFSLSDDVEVAIATLIARAYGEPGR